MNERKHHKGSGIGGLILSTVVCVAGIAILRSDAKKEAEKRMEEQRRTNTPCDFSDGVSENEFKEIVQNVAKRIKRITFLSIDGPKIYGTIMSQSGITEWNFIVDFNDYGHLSGKYWISSDNSDSEIPTVLANRIAMELDILR